MKNTLIITVGLIAGIIIGGALGFFIPFGIAQINTRDAQALSFLPMLTIPLGAVLGAALGTYLGIRKVRIIQFLEGREV
ncbi:MAG: hypothetical protein P1V20_31690 [Verrucomicrobiales bacterium]|nr:hypothetical protein [Verrucomicrobiales bacterium]